MALDRHILLAPHFPALRADTLRRTESRVQDALRTCGKTWHEAGVEVLVTMSAAWAPEGPFQIDNGARHKTLVDFAGIETDLRETSDGWPDLANALHANGIDNGLPVETVHRGMDHGTAVPLSYLCPDLSCRVVMLSASQRRAEDLALWGEVVRRTCEGAGARIAIFVGGSLSYNIEAFAEGKDHAEGRELDRMILGRLEAGDWDGLARTDPAELAAGVAQEDLRHLWFLGGVLGSPEPGRVLAYHRHPSVGSAVVSFDLNDDQPAGSR
ncbi:MAG: hypothetical protein ACE5IK_11225 [Acidobacteriota bacterium]